MKLEKQACMLALAAILLLIVGAFVVGFPAGATLAEETDIDLNAFEGSVILEDPVYFQEATPDEPEVKPTQQPTIEPTQAPGEQPTVEPTHEPTAEPAMDAKFTVQITPPTGWRNTASAQACVDIADENGTGFKQVKVSTGGAGWMDVTEQAESGSFDLDVYDNGTLTVRVIDRQDVERAQKTSASFQAANRFGKPGMSPWNTSPDAMWMKTAIKRLAAWMPQVEILSMALEEDSKADRDTLEASGKSEAEAINEAIAASSVPLPGSQNDADADSGIESDGATQAVADAAVPEPAQEQAAAFVPPYQTFTCPHNGAQVTEDDCYDCKHRTGCPHWEAAPAAE